MSEPIQLHEILEWAAQRSPHLDTSDLSRWIREYASSVANERTVAVTAERDALKEDLEESREWATDREAAVIAYSNGQAKAIRELSELRARVERIRGVLQKGIDGSDMLDEIEAIMRDAE